MTKRLQIDYREHIHEYRVNDQRCESVTEIIPFISGVPEDRLANKREIGKRVHMIVEDHIKYGPNCTSEHDDVIEGYIESFERAREELGLVVALDSEDQPICERIVWHPLYGYAGRIDLVCYSERLGIPPDEPCMLDLKTVALLSAMTALQVSAYLEAYNAYFKGKAPMAKHRAALRLKPDGSLPEFRVYPMKATATQNGHKEDFAAFLNMLGTYRWFARAYKSPPTWEEIVGAWMEKWTPPISEEITGVAF